MLIFSTTILAGCVETNEEETFSPLSLDSWQITDTVGWWQFNEGAGYSASDSSNYDNDGICDTPLWTPGIQSFGLLFSSENNDAVTIDDNPSLDFDDLAEGEGFMIDFWMQNRNTSFIQTYVGLVSKQHKGGYMVAFTDKHRITFNIKSPNASQTKSVKSNTIINDTLWHHVVAVWSGDTLYIYVDDMKNPDNSNHVGNFTIGDTSKWLDIGNDWPTDNKNPFDGKIDEVRICRIKSSNS